MNDESRPVKAAPDMAADDGTTVNELPMVEWLPCPVHAFLAVSVIVVAGAPPWCIGLADDIAPIRGHWVEQVAA